MRGEDEAESQSLLSPSAKHLHQMHMPRVRRMERKAVLRSQTGTRVRDKPFFANESPMKNTFTIY